MGLRILTNVASQEVQKNLRDVSGETSSSLERLSSGKRINKAADDAAGLAIAKNLEAQTRGLRQAKRNANDGVSLVQTAEGGLNEVSEILIRLRELTIQSASDTIGSKERGFLDREYQHLVSEVDRISQSTIFNGSNLINGEGNEQFDFQVGAFAGEQNVISFDASETNASADALSIAGTGIQTKDDAKNSIQYLDDAIVNVSGQRASLGAIQSRLQSTSANLDVQIINQDSARSVIEDTDVAAEASALAANNVIKSAGVATLSQANNIPNSALRLLG